MEKRGGREGREGFVYGIGGIILFPQAKLIRWGSQDREVEGEGAKAPTSTGAKPKRHIENTTAMANTNNASTLSRAHDLFDASCSGREQRGTSFDASHSPLNEGTAVRRDPHHLHPPTMRGWWCVMEERAPPPEIRGLALRCPAWGQ